jgi:hypothetical protein
MKEVAMASAAIPDEPRKEDYATEDAYYDALSDYYAQWSLALWEAADPNTIWRNPALDNPWVSEICDKLIELSAIDDKAAHQQALVEAGIMDEGKRIEARRAQRGGSQGRINIWRAKASHHVPVGREQALNPVWYLR